MAGGRAPGAPRAALAEPSGPVEVAPLGRPGEDADVESAEDPPVAPTPDDPADDGAAAGGSSHHPDAGQPGGLPEPAPGDGEDVPTTAVPPVPETPRLDGPTTFLPEGTRRGGTGGRSTGGRGGGTAPGRRGG